MLCEDGCSVSQAYPAKARTAYAAVLRHEVIQQKRLHVTACRGARRGGPISGKIAGRQAFGCGGGRPADHYHLPFGPEPFEIGNEYARDHRAAKIPQNCV